LVVTLMMMTMMTTMMMMMMMTMTMTMMMMIVCGGSGRGGDDEGFGKCFSPRLFCGEDSHVGGSGVYFCSSTLAHSALSLCASLCACSVHVCMHVRLCVRVHAYLCVAGAQGAGGLRHQSADRGRDLRLP
jgi:hypothetical protein